MADRSQIQIELVKLVGGDRVLRLTEPSSGLSLERKLDSSQPVHGQKQKLLAVFEAALPRAELSVP